jgi:hypothetical protein
MSDSWEGEIKKEVELSGFMMVLAGLQFSRDTIYV